VEPVIGRLVDVTLFHADEAWAQQARPGVEAAVSQRLAQVAAWLDGRKYLEDRFTAADLLMTTVLQILRDTDLVTSVPVLDEYRKRCEDRPGYHKALTDQLAPFAEHAPPGA
jgi:glutathione S-transferase